MDETTDHGIFLLDPLGRVITWNTGAERISGYRVEEVLGRHLSLWYPPGEAEAGEPADHLAVAAARGRCEHEGWRVRKDGSRFWSKVVIIALADDTGGLLGFGTAVREMAEPPAVDRNVEERARLLAHVVAAQEQERRRIAWEVHDDSIQAMVAVGLRLQLLVQRLPEPHVNTARQLQGLVNDAIASLRDIVGRVRPPSIEAEGLASMLAGYLDQVVGPWGLRHALRDDLNHDPVPEIAITLFRICQEALTNVHKHAKATSVDVSVATVEDGTLLRVEDNGIGLRPQRTTTPGHFGVMDMRERAELAGGWLRMANRSGAGTTVECWLPDPLRPPVEDPPDER